MGLSIDSTKFAVQARAAWVRFDETLSLGRQFLLPSAARVEQILKANGVWPPAQGVEAYRREMAGAKWRFEIFARALGAQNVSSCDISAYEGATLIHDMNQPIDAQWEERFDAILDGGTLEHVFNFPVAISNCMRMAKIGGHLILYTPINNYCGHGFYQFSPELFYRVLSKENGFAVERMVALEDNVGWSSLFGVPYLFPMTSRWHLVHDPAKIGERVTLMNRNATILMVLARKIARLTIFQKTPQQSDYLPQWESGPNTSLPGETAAGNRLVNWLRSKLPESFYREFMPRWAVLVDPFRAARFRRKNSFANRKMYEPLND